MLATVTHVSLDGPGLAADGAQMTVTLTVRAIAMVGDERQRGREAS